MTRRVELAVIGAGPAGLAAATTGAELGLETVLLDEQAAPGGQIYRNIEAVTAGRPGALELLGPDYSAGLELVRAFRASSADYLAETQVFEAREGRLGILSQGGAELLEADQILMACGAIERPVPIPGWTLPGVLSVGAAQTLLKSSSVVPEGPTVIAGSGPLVLLVAWQLARAGVPLRAILQTTPAGRLGPNLAKLAANAANRELWKGLGWLRELRHLGVQLIDKVERVWARGGDRLAQVGYRRGGIDSRIEASTLLLHEGVVPNLQLTRAADCAHLWDEAQRCWRPETDAFGRTSIEGLSVAGDCAGIGGAGAAASLGRIAALAAAAGQGRLADEARDGLAQMERLALRRHLRLRPFLDSMFRPADAMVVPGDEIIVCRCEEIGAGEIRRVAVQGAPGPNQAKAFTRAGMGPCQGRMCGLTVSELLAEAQGQPMAAVGHFRIRPPIKPVTVGDMANMAGLGPARGRPVS